MGHGLSRGRRSTGHRAARAVACEDGNATHLGRGRLTDGNRLADFETLFVATPCVESIKHFDSRISFDGAGENFGWPETTYGRLVRVKP